MPLYGSLRFILRIYEVLANLGSIVRVAEYSDSVGHQWGRGSTPTGGNGVGHASRLSIVCYPEYGVRNRKIS